MLLKPNYSLIFSEKLVDVPINKFKIIFDTPMYARMCILDLSLKLMSDFHYKV